MKASDLAIPQQQCCPAETRMAAVGVDTETQKLLFVPRGCFIGGDSEVYVCVTAHACAGTRGVEVCEGQRTPSAVASATSSCLLR